jgi:predicted aldo/keto reductase-like oxidoreductase
VGITIMKPLATGLLPAPLALKWLLNQPIAIAVPGPSTLANVEENSMIGCLGDITLTADEEKDVDQWTRRLEHVRCRICLECEPPCPVAIPIGNILGTFSIYEKYRNLGPEVFAAMPWSAQVVAENRQRYPKTIRQIEACDDCGLCLKKCPYELPIPQMLREKVPHIQNILRIFDEAGY